MLRYFSKINVNFFYELKGVTKVRNILALIAAFTLSTSTTMSVMACNDSSKPETSNMFDWSGIFNDFKKFAQDNPGTTEHFFDYLLKNPNNTWGKDLYTEINNYVNLSILKNDPKFSSDYASARKAASSEVENQLKSLQAKGRGWEKIWTDFLKDVSKTGGGGTIDSYIDFLLKGKAPTIIQRSYITQNYQDYQYYTQTDINPWLQDLWEKIRVSHTYDNVTQYVDGEIGKNPPGPYAKQIWIVATAVTSKVDYDALNTKIQNSKNWTDIDTSFKVVKTEKNIKDNPELVDTYSPIEGLFSNKQTKIAKVMIKNQEPVWTRQIVIPFDDNKSPKALQTTINAESFSQNEKTLMDLLKRIKNDGFDKALYDLKFNDPQSDTTKSGDLGLVNISGKTPTATASFQYYLYRYVTSAQGVGNGISGVQAFNLPQFIPNNIPTKTDVISLINAINHQVSTNASATSQYNDLVYIKDDQHTSKSLPDPSNNGPGVGVFIDAAGIHFIETPGITYHPQMSSKSNVKIITDFKNLAKSKGTLVWEDVKDLVNRQDGLTSTPYLDYLQTEFLLQTQNGDKKSFDLNESIKDYTKPGDISSPEWWDYILSFNNNTNLINWNVSAITGTNFNGDQDTVDKFAQSMKTWFTTTLNSRWQQKQQTSKINNTFQASVDAMNDIWDGYGEDAPVARMDSKSIIDYLNIVGDQTIWWYDQNDIK